MNVGFRPLNISTDWSWVQAQQPVLLVEDTSGVVAFDKDTNDVLAACVMDNWSNNSVEAHLMMPNPIVQRYGFLQLIAGLVFQEQGCRFMYGQVPSNNKKALRLNKHLGFKEVARLPDAMADGVDYVLLSLEDKDCTVMPNPETITKASAA